ncbi:uncharacterized protein V6R79_000184 [Siganus canaliculatus]
MKDYGKFLAVNITCCMLWIFSPTAEGTNITAVVGSRLTLRCDNRSVNPLTQLTWKKDGATLFTFKPDTALHTSNKSLSLNIKLSASESYPYTLILEQLYRNHTGKYTCEINTERGPEEEQQWNIAVTGQIHPH